MSYVWYIRVISQIYGGYYFNLYISFYIFTKNRRRKSNFWKAKGAMTHPPPPLILKFRDIARPRIN